MEPMKTWGWAAIAVLAGTSAGLALPNGVLLTPAGADPAVCTATSCSFLSPNGTIDCSISVGSPAGTPDGATCAWSDDDRAHLVKLLPSGALEPCINPFADVIDRCKATPQGWLPALGYGQTAALGPFTCLAEAQSITCTAAPSGKGFSINSTGILPAAAAPPPPPPPPPIASEVPPPSDAPPPPSDAPPAPDQPAEPPAQVQIS